MSLAVYLDNSKDMGPKKVYAVLMHCVHMAIVQVRFHGGFHVRYCAVIKGVLNFGTPILAYRCYTYYLAVIRSRTVLDRTLECLVLILPVL